MCREKRTRCRALRISSEEFRGTRSSSGRDQEAGPHMAGKHELWYLGGQTNRVYGKGEDNQLSHMLLIDQLE